jgi:hypothetical protein
LVTGLTAVHLVSSSFLGLRGFMACFALPAPPPQPTQSQPWRSSCSSFKRIKVLKITVSLTCRRVPVTVRFSFITVF